MPRYNQSTVQQGQVADPTAGLANLAQEAKSQDELNKQQRQRYAAVRQAIAVKGLMGKVGVKSTSGGNIEITGAEGGMSDSDAKKAYYEIEDEDDGIVGKGKTSTTTIDTRYKDQADKKIENFKSEENAASADTVAFAKGVADGSIPPQSRTNVTLPQVNTPQLGNPAGVIQQIMNGVGGINNQTSPVQVPLNPNPTSANSQALSQNSGGTNYVMAPNPNNTGSNALPPAGNAPNNNPTANPTPAQNTSPAINVTPNGGVKTPVVPNARASVAQGMAAGSNHNYALEVSYKGGSEAYGGSAGKETTQEDNDGGTIVDNVRMSRRGLMAAQLDADSQSNAWGGQKTSVYDNAIAQKDAINKAVNIAKQSIFHGSKEAFGGQFTASATGRDIKASASEGQGTNISNNNSASGAVSSPGSGANPNAPTKMKFINASGQEDTLIVKNNMVEANKNTSSKALLKDMDYYANTNRVSEVYPIMKDRWANNPDLQDLALVNKPSSGNKVNDRIEIYNKSDVDSAGNPKKGAKRKGYVHYMKSSAQVRGDGSISDAQWSDTQKRLGGYYAVTLDEDTSLRQFNSMTGQNMQDTQLNN